MTIEPREIFAAVACNRMSQALDLALNIPDALVYAAGNLVCLLKTKAGLGGVKTFKGHDSTVTCLLYTRASTNNYLITGSNDKTVILWEILGDKLRLKTVLRGHSLGIVALGSVNPDWNPNQLIFASADSNNEIKIWEMRDSQVELVTTINTKPHITLALCFGYLPQTDHLMLFAGGTDHKLHAYLRKGSVFERVVSIGGHTDWIRSIKVIKYTGLTSETKKTGFCKDDMVIATASQDKYIRIWKLCKADTIQSLKDLDSIENYTQLSTKAHIFSRLENEYALMLDAVLMGHDDWVFTVSWQPMKDGDQPMVLVSSSSDKTVIIWYPDCHGDSWMPRDRVGEIGGTTYGFYGGRLSPDGAHLYSNGYSGSIHIWKKENDNWDPVIGVSGHSLSVEECQWDPTGTFLLTTSLDQTSRIFSSFKKNQVTWHEIARSQIHGYDLLSCAFINKYQYVSGADEKVVRVFDAPRTFALSLQNLSKVKEEDELINARPVGANLPALGLSNKAVFEGEGPQATLDVRLSSSTVSGIQNAITSVLEQPPFEEHLLQNTLWPEIGKLYGHGYEIIKVAANKQGTLFASCSRATNIEYAAIRIWSAKSMTQIGNPLEFHTLTVTSIQFSNSGTKLLTAGRDRAWALFDISKIETGWKLIEGYPKAHSRIIWTCGFSHDDQYFATGSRDKTLKLWSLEQDQVCLIETIKFEHSVTSLAFFTRLVNGKYLCAAGLENGDIIILFFALGETVIVDKISFDQSITHTKTVKSLSWNPTPEGIFLASCSEDHSVKVYQID